MIEMSKREIVLTMRENPWLFIGSEVMAWEDSLARDGDETYVGYGQQAEDVAPSMAYKAVVLARCVRGTIERETVEEALEALIVDDWQLDRSSWAFPED